ncbi:MAG: cobalt-precorrin-6A reductase [Rhodospirillales bacterium]|nr:cobalt-precorrin-6A reductase [Rhodospirillales bacterium]
MAKIKRLLILGGTSEGADLAERAVVQFSGRLDVIYSLAGRVKPARELTARVRVGGFGGGQGLSDYLDDEGIDLLIDATHPFAATISANAYDACLTTETPRLTLTRPPWILPPGVKFLEAEDMLEAGKLLSGFAKRVLVTTGQKGFEALAKYPDIHFTIRVIEPPSEPPELENYTLLTSRPPYTLDDELALMEELNIDCLLAKQSGGEASVAKITAAIRRRIPIVLLRRPLPEPGDEVDTVGAALLWLESRV